MASAGCPRIVELVAFLNAPDPVYLKSSHHSMNTGSKSWVHRDPRNLLTLESATIPLQLGTELDDGGFLTSTSVVPSQASNSMKSWLCHNTGGFAP